VLSSALQAIGRTPVIELQRIVPPTSARVLVKWEGTNPTGSYKDRMALAMVEGAEERGELRPGTTVVEFTGGSTGSSLAFVCAAKGYPFRVVSSDAFAPEKLATMAAFGADVVVVPSHGAGIGAELIGRMRVVVEEMVRAGGVYWTNQFVNRDSLRGYAQIGQELLRQVDGTIDAFCGGVGTAGMLMGVSGTLHDAGIDPRVVLLEPATSPFISAGVSGLHHIEGVGVGLRPPLLDDALFDEARPIDEGLARETARRLAREEAIFTGTSGGMNVAAALQLAAEFGTGHTVVTVACDTGLKYLSGDLFRPRPDDREPPT
jgi:cysteine synthase A